jgi:hypothetical protein
MVRTDTFAWAILYCLAASGPAAADGFAIDLEVKAPKGSRTVHEEPAGFQIKPKPRAVLEVQTGDSITIKWVLATKAPKETVKDVLVHFYAVKIDKPGDPPPSKLGKDVLLESALTMDFKPKDKSEGELNLQLDKPGTYLLRLETRGAAVGPMDHEHVATLDLVVR